MPRRSALAPQDLAAWPNLLEAFHRAAKGKRERDDVRAFAAELDLELNSLRCQLLTGELELSPFRTLVLHDPKRRVIRVPSFRERVLQHAVLAPMTQDLLRWQGMQSFACVPGRGIHAALRCAQRYSRLSPVCVRTDIRHCYDTIDHSILYEMLVRRFKHPGTLRILEALISRYENTSGKGLPIGTRFAQHMANLYLSAADRFLLEHLRVHHMVRYMDDFLWWVEDEDRAAAQLEEFQSWLAGNLQLVLHERTGILPSKNGVPFLGAVVYPGRLWLTHRGQRRYRRALQEFIQNGSGDSASEVHWQQTLTARTAAILHCDTKSWRSALHRELKV